MFSGPESGERLGRGFKESVQDIMAERKARILIIDADVDASNSMAIYLRQRNFEVFQDYVGTSVATTIADMHLGLILLDIDLPAMDGFEVCRRIRAEGLAVPIVILANRDDEFDQVLGLELGADDYIPKPVANRVLLARIRALLRRSGQDDGVASDLPVDLSINRLQSLSASMRRFDDASAHDAPAHNRSAKATSSPVDGTAFAFGRLHINRVARQVILAGEIIDISAAEFDLLWLLAANAGRVLPRHEILKALRGLDYDGIDRSIDSRVSRLRRKLSDALGPQSHIKTVRPHGYLFTPTAW